MKIVTMFVFETDDVRLCGECTRIAHLHPRNPDAAYCSAFPLRRWQLEPMLLNTESKPMRTAACRLGETVATHYVINIDEIRSKIAKGEAVNIPGEPASYGTDNPELYAKAPGVF